MNGAVKWLGAGLMGSLLLNFFIIFILVRVISHTVGEGPGRHGRMHGPDFTVGQLTESLSPKSRTVVRDLINSRRGAMRDNFMAMRDARHDLERALTGEEFDKEALSSAFANIRANHLRVQETLHDAIAEAAAKLPQEERVKLARMGERLFRGMSRHHPMGANGPGDLKP